MDDSAALSVHLDVPLPQDVAVGRGSALFVCGWCFSPAGRIRSLSFLYDGETQAVAVHGMPRLDPFRQLHPGIDPSSARRISKDRRSPEDPEMLSYRSGFWGMLRLASPAADTERKLLLRAELPGGNTASAELASIRTLTSLARPVPVSPPRGEEPIIAICMATHNPPRDLLARQLQSIRAQTHSNWICLVSDDCSKPSALQALREEIADDPRFVLDHSPRRLGFYRNFERALSNAPADAAFVAMADQDDYWYPEKLATLLGEIGDAPLIYSDARIVARDGGLVSETYWSRRRNNHSSMLSLLVANSVTGAASLFRREVLDYALPFPPGQFSHYHDHWIAATALALGDIRFVKRPLYDYVQHGGASLGHARANRMPTLRERVGALRTRGLRERMRKWRMHYFVDLERLMQFATVLELRCGERIRLRKRREIRRVLRADESLLTMLIFAWRGLRELFGRKETLGAEWMLFGALLWRRLLAISARERPQRRLRLDAVPPPTLAPGPAREVALEGTAPRAISEKIAPLDFQPREDAPRRVNLLIPTIDLEHLFGGYIAKLNLARRLAERGTHVRIVTVDPTPPLPRFWKRQLESYSGLSGITDRVEFMFGRESTGIEVSTSDGFIATTWWTAHIARDALIELGGSRFLYMIQEYEPFTFPMGTYAALAIQSYEAPHAALFSTELLRDYFRRHRIGVYAHGAEAGDRASAAFENAITAVEPPRADELAARSTRRLLFYARPETHAARNMFELGVLALSRAIEDGAFQRGWELRGIGTIAAGRRLALGGDVQLELVPRARQDRYAQLLREHDLGLALMHTPHPSLVPIEMASAGMLTVTNSFENKTPEAMAAISPNLLATEPTIEGVAAALREAAAGVDDVERRMRGADVRWSRDWDQSLDDDLMGRVEALLPP